MLTPIIVLTASWAFLLWSVWGPGHSRHKAGIAEIERDLAVLDTEPEHHREAASLRSLIDTMNKTQGTLRLFSLILPLLILLLIAVEVMRATGRIG